MSSTRYSCQILMILEYSRQIFEKHSNIKFHEDASGGSRVVPCGRRAGRTDMTKLTVAFRNFAKHLKIRRFSQMSQFSNKITTVHSSVLKTRTLPHLIKQFLRILWKPEIHYCLYNNPQLTPNISQINPFCSLKVHFFKTHLYYYLLEST